MKKIVKSLIGIALALCIIFSSSTSAFAYTVKEGDTVRGIAAAHGISEDELLGTNPDIKDRNKIYVGQEINVGKETYQRVTLTDSEKKIIGSLFDADYYRKTYGDVVEKVGDTKEALWQHYLEYGFWEARQPNANFNVNAYASAYDDVRNAFMSDNRGKMIKDITLHYATLGKQEGRCTATIDACINEGKDVLYFGAYDNGTDAKAQGAIVAAVPKENNSGAPVLTTYVEASRKASLEVITELAGLYTTYYDFVGEYAVSCVDEFLSLFETAKANPSIDNINACLDIATGFVSGLECNTESEDDYTAFLVHTHERYSDVLTKAVNGQYSDWNVSAEPFNTCPGFDPDNPDEFYDWLYDGENWTLVMAALGIEGDYCISYVNP